MFPDLWLTESRITLKSAQDNREQEHKDLDLHTMEKLPIRKKSYERAKSRSWKFKSVGNDVILEPSSRNINFHCWLAVSYTDQ